MVLQTPPLRVEHTPAGGRQSASRRLRAAKPIDWSLARDRHRRSLRGHLAAAVDYLAAWSSDPYDRRYWNDRSRSLERCGYLKRHDCVCGQGYGKVSWPCHQRLCPWCAARRASVQLERIEAALQAQRAQGVEFTPVLVTLTNPDRQFCSLVAGVDALTDRLAKLERRAVWRSVGVLGRVTAIEITRGRLSRLWHPHAHVLVLLPGSWAPAEVAAWGELLIGEWVAELAPGASRAGQDVRPIGLDGLGEAVKYSVKASMLVLDGAGVPRPVADAAADVAEVTLFLRKRRLLRTAGCLHGLQDGLEDEAALPEDVADDAPACLACGAPDGLREVPDRCEDGRWLNRIPRWWCVPYPGVRGWYVQVLATDWDVGAELVLAIDCDVGEVLADRLRAGV
jgi:hypothetical protein